MKFLILTTVFIMIFLLVLSVYYLEMDRRNVKKERMLRRLARERRSQRDDGDDEKSRKSVLEILLSRFMDIAMIETLLIAADASISTGRFLTLSAGMGLIFIIPPLILLHNPFLMFLFLMAGASIPAIYFIYRRKKREETLVKQLPEAIHMITRALKAGQSLDGALHEIARRLPPPVGSEIRTVYDEMAMGLAFETAIRNFEKRYPQIADIRILCTAFVIQRETGGNLTAILSGLAATIRARFTLKMQIKALTAEGRITSWILAMIPIAFTFFIWILNPGYIDVLFTHPVGQKMVLCALVLVGLGFYVMKKLSLIEV